MVATVANKAMAPAMSGKAGSAQVAARVPAAPEACSGFALLVHDSPVEAWVAHAVRAHKGSLVGPLRAAGRPAGRCVDRWSRQPYRAAARCFGHRPPPARAP